MRRGAILALTTTVGVVSGIAWFWSRPPIPQPTKQAGPARCPDPGSGVAAAYSDPAGGTEGDFAEFAEAARSVLASSSDLYHEDASVLVPCDAGQLDVALGTRSTLFLSGHGLPGGGGLPGRLSLLPGQLEVHWRPLPSPTPSTPPRVWSPKAGPLKVVLSCSCRTLGGGDDTAISDYGADSYLPNIWWVQNASLADLPLQAICGYTTALPCDESEDALRLARRGNDLWRSIVVGGAGAFAVPTGPVCWQRENFNPDSIEGVPNFAGPSGGGWKLHYVSWRWFPAAEPRKPNAPAPQLTPLEWERVATARKEHHIAAPEYAEFALGTLCSLMEGELGQMPEGAGCGADQFVVLWPARRGLRVMRVEEEIAGTSEWRDVVPAITWFRGDASESFPGSPQGSQFGEWALPPSWEPPPGTTKRPGCNTLQGWDLSRDRTLAPMTASYCPVDGPGLAITRTFLSAK